MYHSTIFTAQQRGGAPVPGGSRQVASQRRGTPSSDRRDKVFVCYSHSDQRWLDRLLVHLALLEQQGRVEVWSDRRIVPGSQWRREIRRAIEESKAAILLVSADFIASEFITRNELPPLLRAAETRGVRILCLIISHSSFRDTALVKFQAINPPSRPLDSMPRGKRERFFNLTYAAVKDALS